MSAPIDIQAPLGDEWKTELFRILEPLVSPYGTRVARVQIVAPANEADMVVQAILPKRPAPISLRCASSSPAALAEALERLLLGVLGKP